MLKVFHRSNAIYTDVNKIKTNQKHNNNKNPTQLASKCSWFQQAAFQDKVIHLITHSNKMASLIKKEDKDQLLGNGDYKTNNKGWTFMNFKSNS